MNYYFLSDKSHKILEILFCLDRDAKINEIEAVAQARANEARCTVRVLRDTGLTFAPCLGYGEREVLTE